MRTLHIAHPPRSLSREIHALDTFMGLELPTLDACLFGSNVIVRGEGSECMRDAAIVKAKQPEPRSESEGSVRNPGLPQLLCFLCDFNFRQRRLY